MTEERAGGGREPAPEEPESPDRDRPAPAPDREERTAERRALATEVLRRIVAPDTRALSSLLVVVLAFVSALAVGAIFVVLSDASVFSARDPLAALSTAGGDVVAAYGALWAGAVGDWSVMGPALTGQSGAQLSQAFYPLSETLVAAAPLAMTGLAVAIGFRAGVFNIGGQGQVLAGGLVAGWAGFTIHGLPAVIHVPLALAAGLAAGAAWGLVPGLLKAWTGAHEVITTIMLNYVGIYLTYQLLNGVWFQQPGRSDPISRQVDPGAVLPHLAGPSLRLHAGVILALLLVLAVKLLMQRTVLGFEFRAAGSNPSAARAAGIKVERVIVLVMAISGALMGLAGADVVLGVQYELSPGFDSGIGFDGITVALLGRTNPAGIAAA
ncbi:MAG: ABC transporter permease, partial [Candidatus Dormibacterales bacterium]